MATAIITLYKWKKLKDGFPIMLRITANRKQKYYSLGLSATEKQWDEENGLFKKDKRVNPDTSREVTDMEINRVKKEVTDSYNIKNEFLSSELIRAKDIIREFEKKGTDWTFQMFENTFRKRPSAKVIFMEYLQTHINNLNDTGKYGNALAFNSLRVNMTAFSNEKKTLKVNKLVLQDISVAFMKKYISWLESRGCRMNTINIYLRTIRALLNVAINDNIMTNESYPFTSSNDKNGGKIKIADYKEVTKKRFLPVQYIRQMKEAELPTDLDKARHLFLFCFFCYGISFADAARLKQSDIVETVTKDGNLMKIVTYQRTKTHKPYRIPISPELQKEIDWFQDNYNCVDNYLLPVVTADKTGEALQEHIINKRKKFSKLLKRIAATLEFPDAFRDLSTYVSRHSFAMALRGKGAGTDIIGQALGHESTETTRIYLESFDDDIMAKIGEDLI